MYELFLLIDPQCKFIHAPGFRNLLSVLSSDPGSAFMLADFSVKQRLHFLVPSVHGSCKLRTTKTIICYYFSTPRHILSVLLRLFFFTFISKRSCMVIVTLFEGFFTSTIVVFNLVYICAIKCVWCTKHFV